MEPAPELSSEAFEYVVHHVFLPPKLPQRADFNYSHERELLDVVLAASKSPGSCDWLKASCLMLVICLLTKLPISQWRSSRCFDNPHSTSDVPSI